MNKVDKRLYFHFSKFVCNIVKKHFANVVSIFYTLPFTCITENFCEPKNLKTSNKSKRELTGNNNDFVRNTKCCRLSRVREKVRSRFHQNTGTRSERNLSIVDL